MAKLWKDEVQAASSTQQFSSVPIINENVKQAIAGLQPYIQKKFKLFPTEEDKRLLAEFIIVSMREQNIKVKTKKAIVYSLDAPWDILIMKNHLNK